MNVKHVELEKPLVAICREYTGKITDTRRCLDDVQQFFQQFAIRIKPGRNVSVFFESENRAWHGALAEDLDQNLPEDLFEIEMPDATYLTVTFEHNPIDNLSKAMEELEKAAAERNIRRGPRTYIITRPNGEDVVFDVMQRILTR